MVSYIRSSHRQKRKFQLRFFSSSEQNRSHALFHDRYLECPECKQAFFSRKAWTLIKYIKVLSPSFMRINCEIVVKNESERLFYGILPLLECFLVAVIPVMFVSFQSS